MNKSEFTSAPTQSMLQTWLRNSHGAHVLPMLLGYYYDYNVFYPRSHCLMCTGKFESYEDALEVGLQKALEVI